MVKKIIPICLMFLTLNAFGQEHEINSRDPDLSAPSESQTGQRVDLAPDLTELLVEIDPRAQGIRARNHQFQLQLDWDPLVNGRLTLGFQIKLTDMLSIDIPVSFDHRLLGQWFGYQSGAFNVGIENHWSISAGAGLKVRLTEWITKSSFYFEPLVQIGYYTQTVSLPQVVRQSIRIRPAVYFGWERLFDTGFVIGAKIGIEKPFDIALGNSLVYPTLLSVVPMLGVGYAW